MNLRHVAGLLALSAVWFRGAWQDPPPAKPSETPAAATTAQGGATGAREEKKHPIEGVYSLTKRVVAGDPDKVPGEGWLAITKRHLFVCLAGPGKSKDAPLVTASVQSWQVAGAGFETEVKIGCFTDVEGEFRLEPKGVKRSRRIEVARGVLRVYQDDKSYLEFERVE
ncbi:MAG: hypothetical protein RL398_2981 [Planctomycetota bacterium]|jgi:hypothetical protein